MFVNNCSKCKKLAVKLHDYYNLLFKSNHQNYYRIESCKKDKVGKVHCDVSFNSYSALRNFQKKLRRVSFGLSTVVAATVIVSLLTNLATGPVLDSMAASYGFNQTSWSGGLSVDEAAHGNDQTNWSKYSSSTDEIVINNSINLATSSFSFTDSLASDFNNGQTSNLEIDSGNNWIRLSTSADSYSIVQTDDSANIPSPGVKGGWKSRGVSLPFSGTGMSGVTMTDSGDNASVSLYTVNQRTAFSPSGVDHGGADWTPASGEIVSGSHYNVGNFTSTWIQLVNLVPFELQAENITINGGVSGFGRGYPGGFNGTSGSGPGGGAGGSYGAGGGYGGKGANASGAGGVTYGSDRYPNDFGSGGGGTTYSGGHAGGRGGGYVRLHANNVLNITSAGTINVNAGAPGTRGGGGSGGSVFLSGTEIIGTGSIYAKGTNGGGGIAGGGGGGRVVLEYTKKTYSGTIGVEGGIGGDVGSIYNFAFPNYTSNSTYSSYFYGGIGASYDWSNFQFSKTSSGYGGDATAVNMRIKSSLTASLPVDISTNGCTLNSDDTEGSFALPDLSACVDSAHPYLWYKATLVTAVTARTPVLQAVDIDVDVGRYYSSGTFTSQIFDTITNKEFTTIVASITEPGNSSTTIRVASSNLSSMSDVVWSDNCNVLMVGNTGNISDSACVNNQEQYVQYQVVFHSSIDRAETPYLNEVSINYLRYTSSTQSLISSKYDSSSEVNIMGGIIWQEDIILPTNTSVLAYLRVASTSILLNDADWHQVATSTSVGLDPSVSCSKDGNGLVTCLADALPVYMKDGDTAMDDRWFQYKIELVSDGANTPTVERVQVVYVVNAAPEFEANYGIPVTQNSDGTITFSYKPRDIDTLDGSETPGFVTPIFQYSTNSGLNWNTITSGLSIDATSSKAVDNAFYPDPEDALYGDPGNSFAAYSVTWEPRNMIDGAYSTTTKIKIILNDNEAANNITSSSTDEFVLDLSYPTADDSSDVYTAIKIDGREQEDMNDDQVKITLKADDDSDIYYRYSLDSDPSVADGINTNSAIWTLDNDVKSEAGLTLTISLNPSDGFKKDYIYVQYKDEFENINTTIYEVETPERPTGMMIQDITNTYVDPTEAGLFVSWKTSSMAEGGSDEQGEFKCYLIERSIESASGPYTNVSTSCDKTINFYRDNDVSSTTNYYYRVYVVDGIGNKSYYSATEGDDNAVLHGLPNGTQDAGEGGGGTPATPPNISNVDHASAVHTTQVTITWDTDKLSDSRVEYLATETAPVDSEEFASSSAPFVGVASFVTSGSDNHRVTITGLIPDTNYYYLVKSTDINSNTAISYNNATYKFRTDAGPVISSSSILTSFTNTSVTVTWTTDIASDSYVGYSTDILMTNPAPVEVGQNDSVTDHQITIPNLNPGTTYYFYVKSDNAQDDKEGTYHSVKTSSDTSPPIISNINSTTKRTSAIISWNTNEDADSKIIYGMSSGVYSYFNENASTTKVHLLSLASLQASTTYYFKVVSTDSNGNHATSSSEYTFKTEGLNITNVEVTTLTVLSVRIDWNTDEAATSSVEYSTDSGLSGSVIETAETSPETSHTKVISALPESTTYYYRVINYLGGQVFYSPIYYFVTGDSNAPVISSGPTVTSLSTKYAIITWTTDELSTSVVRYGASSGSLTSDETDLTKSINHSVKLSGLDVYTQYFYTVESEDPNSNLATSSENTFTTKIFEISDVFADAATSTVDITWVTNESASSRVEYSLFPGLSPSTFEPTSVPVSSDTAHSITITDLIEGVMYYYKVISVVDGQTVTSRTYNFTTGDATAPQILYKSVSNITDTRATIGWETDELTNAMLKYDTASSGEPYAYSTTTATMSRIHYFTLTGLTPSTQYFYKIESTDSTNNTKTEASTLTTLEPQFSESEVDAEVSEAVEQTEASQEPSSGGGVIIIDKTDKVPPTISNVRIKEVGDTYAKIGWDTDEDASAIVGYGFSSDYSSAETDFNSLISKKRDHEVYLKNLKTEATYHFLAISTDSWGNLSASPDYTFNTLELGAKPETDQDTEESQEDDEMTLEEIQSIIQNLLETGKADEETISLAIRKAGEPPMIAGDGAIVDGVTSRDATITWKTDRRSNSVIVYYPEDLGVNYAQQAGNFSDLTTDHSITLTGLTTGTTYAYTAQSTDALGNVGVSRIDTFTTEAIPYISEVNLTNITNNSVDIA